MEKINRPEEEDYDVIDVKNENIKSAEKIRKKVAKKANRNNDSLPSLLRDSTIIIKHDKKKKYDGSLLRLFKSDFFNVHLLITHLLRSKNEGTMDYLINELYTESLEDIDFYMPQL